MDKLNRRCGLCSYFSAGRSALTPGLQTSWGSCRRYPPVFIPPSLDARVPGVTRDDWCGEFKALDEASAETQRGPREV